MIELSPVSSLLRYGKKNRPTPRRLEGTRAAAAPLPPASVPSVPPQLVPLTSNLWHLVEGRGIHLSQ
jgi:hypothetical protein